MNPVDTAYLFPYASFMTARLDDHGDVAPTVMTKTAEY